MPLPTPDPTDAFAWSSADIQHVGRQVVDWIDRYLASLPAGPVFQPVPESTAADWLATPVPAIGEPADGIFARFASEIGPYPFGNGHPRFAAWVNSPPAVIGIFAAALAAAMNPSVAGGNHGAVWIERQVMQWFKTIFGFPAESMGLLTSGSSAAAITGLAVARLSATARRGWDVRKDGVHMIDAAGKAVRMHIYETAEAHSCHQKAIELLGLGSTSIRVVPTDDALCMRPDMLDAMLAEDLAAGALPIAVIASAGTVNTGAIDPLDAIADICAKHDRVWFHIDGGYGAPAVLTDEYRATLAAIGRADSIGIDAHKWLYVPVDAGVVLVRDAKLMRDTFSLVAPYLRNESNQSGVMGPPWFSEYGAEQTRPFRALKVWMAMRYFGTSGYARLIAHDIAMARLLADRVRQSPDFELWEPQGMSIVCFRALPAGVRDDGDAADALNRRILTAVQLGGAAFLSSTVLRGRVYLRACIVNPTTGPADVDAIIDAVRSYL